MLERFFEPASLASPVCDGRRFPQIVQRPAAKEPPITRWPMVLVCLVMILAACGSVASPSAGGSTPASARASASAPAASPSLAPPPGGRVAYGRFGANGVLAFTANPDGTDEQPLLSQFAEGPRWSPDGSKLSVTLSSPQGLVFFGLVNRDGSGFVQFNSPDPTLQLGCGAWSPDATRLACEGWDDATPARNGIYTVRTSDGGDLKRVTTGPGGAHDGPGDYSPDGKQIVFVRITPGDEEHNTLMVVNVDGTNEHVLTALKVGLATSWAPDGTTILTESDGSLFLVPLDGGQPSKIQITGADTTGTATRPAWSPDGTWIIFSRKGSAGEDIYVMRKDGTNLHQVTNTPGQDEEFGAWG